jgi:hypothetical protein
MGWAVVENASGSDWEGVRVSLVSDDAVAFRQPIFEPITVPRTELPVRIAEAIRVTPDTGAMPPMPAAAPMMAPPPAAAPAPRAAMRVEAAPAPLAATVATEAAAGRVAFSLEQPVTLRSGETANLPFLDLNLPAERLWWVQDLTAMRPLQALRFRNTSNHVLPDGLITVYDGAGAPSFLGDAELRALSPGDQRLIAFARDRDLRLTSQSSSRDEITRVTLRRGFITIDAKRIEETAIAIDPRGARGVMVIDTPRRASLLRQRVILACAMKRFWKRRPKPFALGMKGTSARMYRFGIRGLVILPCCKRRNSILKHRFAASPAGQARLNACRKS